jgi:endonuclease/exonuclease/phosphatase (EEP) superfamily protein YafD
MTTACTLLALALLYSAVTPYLPAKPWRIIDLPSHFVIQGALASLVMICGINVILGMTFDTTLVPAVLATALALALQVKTLKPGTGAAPGKPGNKIKILQANLLKTNSDAAPLLAIAAQEEPDIIACCEVSPAMAEKLQALKNTHPHQRLAMDEKGYGLAVFSKLAFDSIETMKPAGARATSIAFKINNITFVALHTVTPVADIAARDAELLAHAEKFAGVAPLVFMGDFNATPWCPAMRRFCAALNLYNARGGRVLAPSWPRWLPAFMRLPIDHVLVSKAIPVEGFALGSPTGSDHLPTITVITP